MNQKETLLSLIEKLERHKIPYFITGSFASNLHGVPRMTQDADIMVQASLNQLLQLAKDLSQEFYVSEEAVREAVTLKRMFNVVHFEAGYKFDLIPLKQDAFDRSRFERRLSITMEGKSVFFSSAEDIIIAKLLWSLQSGSERQLEDAGGIIGVQKENLDWSYLERWAEILGIKSLLNQIIT